MNELEKITASVSRYAYEARMDERRNVAARLRQNGHPEAADLIDPDSPKRLLEEWEMDLLGR